MPVPARTAPLIAALLLAVAPNLAEAGYAFWLAPSWQVVTERQPELGHMGIGIFGDTLYVTGEIPRDPSWSAWPYTHAAEAQYQRAFRVVGAAGAAVSFVGHLSGYGERLPRNSVLAALGVAVSRGSETFGGLDLYDDLELGDNFLSDGGEATLHLDAGDYVMALQFGASVEMHHAGPLFGPPYLLVDSSWVTITGIAPMLVPEPSALGLALAGFGTLTVVVALHRRSLRAVG